MVRLPFSHQNKIDEKPQILFLLCERLEKNATVTQPANELTKMEFLSILERASQAAEKPETQPVPLTTLQIAHVPQLRRLLGDYLGFAFHWWKNS